MTSNLHDQSSSSNSTDTIPSKSDRSFPPLSPPSHNNSAELADLTSGRSSITEVTSDVSDDNISDDNVSDDNECSSSESDTLSSHDKSNENIALGGTKSPDSKPLDTDALLRVLLDEDPLPCIPIGLKENVYYVIDNSQNIDRRAKGQRSDFTDDCGAWLPGGPTTKSYFISGPNDERKSIQMHKNVFCTMKRVGKGKRIHVPLDPQPDPSTVIALHRYYRKLKASDKYTRRISWLSVGSSDHTKACAEYLGEFPGLMPHGNSKTDQVGYKRTAATVLDAIGQELEKTKSVQSTFGKLQNEAMSTMQPRPRNSKQVENKKYNDAKAKRDELGPNIVGSNLADHF